MGKSKKSKTKPIDYFDHGASNVANGYLIDSFNAWTKWTTFTLDITTDGFAWRDYFKAYEWGEALLRRGVVKVVRVWLCTPFSIPVFYVLLTDGQEVVVNPEFPRFPALEGNGRVINAITWYY